MYRQKVNTDYVQTESKHTLCTDRLLAELTVIFSSRRHRVYMLLYPRWSSTAWMHVITYSVPCTPGNLVIRCVTFSWTFQSSGSGWSGIMRHPHRCKDHGEWCKQHWPQISYGQLAVFVHASGTVVDTGFQRRTLRHTA